MKLLLVEDSTILRKDLAQLFSGVVGIDDVSECDNAPEARAMIDGDPPELIVLDLGLRDSSGLDVLRFVRDGFPLIKVFVFSGHAERTDEVLELGATAFFDKFSDTRLLYDAVVAAAGSAAAVPVPPAEIDAHDSLTAAETRRLAILHRYALLDTLPETEFDELTRTAAQICETPVALISFVDERRQWFKSRYGIDLSETPREQAFCAHAICDPEHVMVVSDAQTDPRFSDNPLVTASPHIRFYAGAPIVVDGDQALGTLCVIDRVPRTLAPWQLSLLRILARHAAVKIQLRSRSTLGFHRGAAEDRLERVVEGAPCAMVMIDQRGTLILVNGEAERLFGYSRAELLGCPIEILIPERFRAAHAGYRRHYQDTPAMRPMGQGRSLFARHKDGTEIPVEIGLNPILMPEGPCVLASVVDISARRQAEAAIERALSEKTVLLNEIHHRVKNNLQVVAGLLSLQAAKSLNAEVKQQLLESQGRIQSMALIHLLLYESKDFTQVKLGPYLQRLSSLLGRSFDISDRTISFQWDCDEVVLDLNRAIPCGLILNELMTNALKHAFPDGRRGTIRVSLKRPADGTVVLAVHDDGVGLPPDFEIGAASTLGLELSGLLAEQLHGSFSCQSVGGARFELSFPIHPGSPSPQP